MVTMLLRQSRIPSIAGLLSGFLIAGIPCSIHGDANTESVPQVPPADKPTAKPEKTFKVNFKNTSWKEVITWYAEVSDLKLAGDMLPPGAVTLQPPPDRQFTIGEVTDLINESLTWHNLILVRSQATFRIQSAAKKIPLRDVPLVEFDDLKHHGKTEVVRILISIPNDVDLSDATKEIQQITTPFGSVSAVKGNSLVVVDAALNVKRLAGMFKVHQEPAGKLPAPRKMKFHMRQAQWPDVLEWYSRQTGLTPFLTFVPKGSFTFIPPKLDQEYTMSEVTDILNETLALQKMVLIRRHQTFVLDRTDPKLDLAWAPLVELAELPNYGKSELLNVLIPLKKNPVQTIAPKAEKLLTSRAPMVQLSKISALAIVDTAANIKKVCGNPSAF